MSGGGAAVVETRVSVREDLLSLLSGALAISSPVAVLVAVVTLWGLRVGGWVGEISPKLIFYLSLFVYFTRYEEIRYFLYRKT